MTKTTDTSQDAPGGAGIGDGAAGRAGAERPTGSSSGGQAGAPAVTQDDGASIQESLEKKLAWLNEVPHRFPMESRVKVVRSDVSSYVGCGGIVDGYNDGAIGEYPAIRVQLDDGRADLFYGDGDDAEIEPA